MKHLISFLFTIAITLTVFGQVKTPETIVYGTVYNVYHERFETEKDFQSTVEYDLKLMKESNLNTLMLYPVGEWDEKTLERKWNRTDFIVDEIEKNDIKFMPILMKSYHGPYINMADWLEIEGGHRELHKTKYQFEEIQWQRPEIQQRIDTYFKNVAERYASKDCFLGYNAWNEPHFWSEDDITLANYKQWLQNKYIRIDSLNQVWGFQYRNFEQITFNATGSWKSSMKMIDQELFRHDNNGEIARWVNATVKKYDSIHPVAINTVGVLPVKRGHSEWDTDEWKIAPHPDILGISFYPDILEWLTGERSEYWRFAGIYTSLRSAAGDKPYYLIEAQTNQRSHQDLFRYMTYDDMHLLSWMAFANNCKGIVFWKWKPFMRGEQMFGRGLVRYDGTLAKRGEAVKDVGAVLKKHGKLLLKAQLRQAQVAVVYNTNGFLKSIENEREPTFFMNKSYEGFYKMMHEANINLDVIRGDIPPSLEELKKYKAIFFNFQPNISPQFAATLKAYVQEGGNIIADSRSLMIDELDFGYTTIPGGGLDEVFGVRVVDGSGCYTNYNISPIANNSLKLKEEENIKVAFYKSELSIYEGTEVIANFTDDKQPALTSNKFGKGKAYMAAFSVGGTYREYNNEAMKELVLSITHECEVTPEVSFPNKAINGLSVKVHKLNKKMVVYAINLNSEKVTGNISVKTDGLKVNLASEIISEKEIAIKSSKGEVVLPIDLMPNRTAVFVIE